MTTNVYAMTDTWNNAGTTFMGIWMDVSNGAGGGAVGAAASRVLRISNSGATLISVDISGNVVCNAVTLASGTFLLATSAGLTSNAAAQVATLTNGPSAGNPTKWIPINDNGTTRNIPAW